jgi:hypothetical protein
MDRKMWWLDHPAPSTCGADRRLDAALAVDDPCLPPPTRPKQQKTPDADAPEFPPTRV